MGWTAGLQLLRQGLCWVYTKYLPEVTADIQATYRQAEAEAREQRRGLWSEPGPVEPRLFRRVARQANKGQGDHVRLHLTSARPLDGAVILTFNQRKNVFFKPTDLARYDYQLLVLPRKFSLPNMRRQRVLAAGLMQLV